jgi:hypothetical protein
VRAARKSAQSVEEIRLKMRKIVHELSLSGISAELSADELLERNSHFACV